MARRSAAETQRFVVREEDTGAVVVVDTAAVIERYTDANAQANAEGRAAALNGDEPTEAEAEAEAEETVPSSPPSA